MTGLIQEYQPAPFGTPEARCWRWCSWRWSACRRSSTGDGSLSPRPRPGLAAPRPDVDPQRPLVRPGGGPGTRRLLDGLPLSFRKLAAASRTIVWAPALATGLLALTATGVSLGGFGETRWPLWRCHLNRQPPAARLFHEQDWGGLIEAECLPVRLSYLDDRFELFGKDAILEYVQTSSPAARSGTRSATAIASTWSGSGPTAVWRSGCSKSRDGPSSTAIRSRCFSGGRRESPPDRGLLLCLGLELLPHFGVSSSGRRAVHSLGWPFLASKVAPASPPNELEFT